MKNYFYKKLKLLNIKKENLFFMLYNKVSLLEWLLCSLCELEMSFKLMLDKKFKSRLDTCRVINKHSGKCDWQETIVEDSLYCSGCEYKSYSVLANFFFGEQCDGYCYFLGRGDFSYVQPTMLLWDGCKECGISYFCGEEEE